MKTFSVHVRDNGDKPKMAVVREGFSLPGALFGPLWALVLGWWDTAWVLLLAHLVIQGLFSVASPAVSGVLGLGLALVTGIVLSELHCWVLSRRGYEEVAIITAPTKMDAEARYLDANPFVLARLEGVA